MRGLEGAELLVSDYLQTNMPAKLAELRIRHGLDPAEAATILPDVAKWTEGPRPSRVLAIDDYPFVTTIGQDTVAAGELERGADRGDNVTADLYRFRYRIRVFAWVRGETWEGTHLRRHRLVLAIRELLLEAIGLDVDYAAVDPQTIRESYSDVVPDEDLRTLAAAYVEVVVVLAEEVTHVGRGTSSAAEVDEVGTPSDEPHPALA